MSVFCWRLFISRLKFYAEKASITYLAEESIIETNLDSGKNLLDVG